MEAVARCGTGAGLAPPGLRGRDEDRHRGGAGPAATTSTTSASARCRDPAVAFCVRVTHERSSPAVTTRRARGDAPAARGARRAPRGVEAAAGASAPRPAWRPVAVGVSGRRPGRGRVGRVHATRRHCRIALRHSATSRRRTVPRRWHASVQDRALVSESKLRILLADDEEAPLLVAEGVPRAAAAGRSTPCAALRRRPQRCSRRAATPP